jgi:hypothetical protein
MVLDRDMLLDREEADDIPIMTMSPGIIIIIIIIYRAYASQLNCCTQLRALLVPHDLGTGHSY